MMDELLLDRYRLETELGRGGMGAVYRAQDTLLGREVAIKVLSNGDLGTQGQARLLKEAKAAAQLNHPNIVGIYDVSESGGTPFIVMEFVEGETLRDQKPESTHEVVSIVRQVCTALEHAHSHGIVHRDLKPENVMVMKSGAVKLMDFGLARSIASRLSQEGRIAGTVYYMAPELALGQKFDGRADLYALGVMLYELLTGRLPFVADDPLAVISQHLYAPVVPPRAHRAEVPAELDSLVLRLMNKQPEARPTSGAEVAQALEAVVASLTEPSVHAAPDQELPLLDRLIRGRFIGRSAELTILRQRWKHAQEGKAQLVLISGEPGIGKSRLANETIAYAQLHGAYVLQGGSYEYETKMPYLPFVEGLRDWVHSQPAESLREMMDSTAVELAKLAPEIEAKLGPLEPNPPLTPEEERLRLYDNVSRFFQTLASDRGLLVFLDDLHWADQGTLTLLHYLLRRMQDERVLVMGAYREVELDRKHPLSAALVAWNRERLVTRMQLTRFTKQECGALLAAMFGQEQNTDEFTEIIYGETEGNPFFIEEVVKALVEQGQIYLENGEWERKAIHELVVPQSIKEAIGRRLDRLSNECIEVLQSAAVLGKDFEFAELAAIIDLDEDDLLDVLDEAGGAQMIQVKSGERFVFTHDKIREVLYQELNPIRQRRLHRQVVNVLERLYAGHLDEHFSDLAYHAVLGGELNKGLSYSLRAAEKASRVFAHEEALNHYQQAKDCAISLGEIERLVAIEEAIGHVQAGRGHSILAAEAFERALGLASTVEKQAQLKSEIGAAFTSVGDERGMEYLRAALDELDAETQVYEIARSTAMMARNYHYRGQYDQSLEYLERARELAEPGGDVVILSDIYGYLSGSYQHLGRYEESNRWARKNIELGEEKDFPAAAALGHEFLSENAWYQANWDTSIYHAEVDRQLGEKMGAQSRIAWSGLSKLGAYRGKGELSAAKSEGWEKLRIAQEIGERRLIVWIKSYLSMNETDMKEDESALERAESAISLAQEQGEPALVSASRSALAYYYIQKEEWQAACEVFASSNVIQSRRQDLGLLSLMWVLYAEALLGCGHLHQAGELIERLIGHTRDRGERFQEGLAYRIQGQLFGTQEHWAEALESCDIAIGLLSQLGSRLELARALFSRGRLYEQMGQGNRAARDLHQALEAFSEIGARRDEEKVRGY